VGGNLRAEPADVIILLSVYKRVYQSQELSGGS